LKVHFILSEAKDFARGRFDLGWQDPSVAALPQDEVTLLHAMK